LITITTGSHYQLAVIVHHHSRFAPLTGGDDVLLITASSPYELAVKTIFTASLLYHTAVITMQQHNKIHNFFLIKSNENKLYIKVVGLDEIYNFVITTFRSQNFVRSSQNFEIHFFQIFKQP
jgi:hypothetical protein